MEPSDQGITFVFGMGVNDYIEAAFSQLAYLNGVYVAQRESTLISSLEKKLLGFSRHYISPDRIEQTPDMIGSLVCQYEASTLEKSSGVKSPNTILLFESPMGIAQSFVGSLRKRYPTAKIYLFLVNALAEYSELLTWVSQVSTFCDGIITCNKRDAESQGWNYYPDCYTPSPVVEDTKEATLDFCFLARDKGRGAIISKIATKLTSLGYTGEYLVVSDESTTRYPLIEYLDHYLPYSEYLKLLSKSRGIVEIVANGETYSTLRTMEAVVYKRALITNNSRLQNEKFFNDKTMLVVNSADDITRENVDQLLQAVLSDKNPDEDNPFSPQGLLKYLESL